MEGPMFSKFKTFLNNLFIRSKREGFNGSDFKNDEFEYIQHHLDELLPFITIEEAQRIRIYFLNAYIFHLNNGLGITNIFTGRSLTPNPINTQDKVVQSFLQERIENNGQSQQKRHNTLLRTTDNSELYPQIFIPEESPLASDNLIQTQINGPLMQSTPLSAPILPGESRIIDAKQTENGAMQDAFIADTICQMNISPIPLDFDPMTNVHRTHMSTQNEKLNEVSFLKNFANVERGEELVHEQQPSARHILRRTRKRLNIGIVARKPKNKMDTFDVFSRLPNTNKTEKQIKKSEESFLYFSLIRGNQTNLTSRSNTIIPEGERGLQSLQRVNNVSNILRAYASQSHNSVELPGQSSQINTTPLTPHGLLRTSLSFTPLRGDISGLEPRMAIDQATNFPPRSMPRQPLLPIPERVSSIHIPLTPQVKEIINNDQATFSNLPREDPKNVEMLDQHSLQIAYDPSQTQEEQMPLNSSVINIQPLIQNEPIFPLEIVQEQPSNLPGRISEGFEMIEQPQLPEELLIAQEGFGINAEMETRQSLHPNPTSDAVPFQEQAGFVEEVPMQLQASVTQDAVPPLTRSTESLPISWLEILRPRADLLEYPREVAINRKKRKRRRRDNEDRVVRPRRDYDLPANVRNISHANINESALAPVGVSDQMAENPPQVEVSNQNLESLVINDLPENSLNLIPRYSEEPDGISHQITQYPIQIETQLKEYLQLVKRAGSKTDYEKWNRFDCCLFNENDHFELHTNIFQQLIENNYVAMDRLYNQGTSRLEAAKGFRFILDLKTMGLIDIESVETRVLGIRLKTVINNKKL